MSNSFYNDNNTITIIMVSYAIIKACGKQFWVEPGRFYDFDKLPLDKDDVFTLNNVLLMNNNGDLSIGKPFLDSSFSLSARVIRHLSGSKIRVYKMFSGCGALEDLEIWIGSKDACRELIKPQPFKGDE